MQSYRLVLPLPTVGAEEADRLVALIGASVRAYRDAISQGAELDARMAVHKRDGVPTAVWITVTAAYLGQVEDAQLFLTTGLSVSGVRLSGAMQIIELGEN